MQRSVRKASLKPETREPGTFPLFDTNSTKAIINPLRFAQFEMKVYSVGMIIDLITLKSSPHSFEYSLLPAAIELESGDAKLKNTVNLKGELTRRIAQTEIDATLAAEIEVECTRCLQTIEQKLEFPFKAVFVTAENYTQAKEAELTAQDLDVSVFEGDKIDLTELVREQILLNLPEQVFCKEHCKGLCEKCGANRNLIDCKCKEKESDPRWDVLKNLK